MQIKNEVKSYEARTKTSYHVSVPFDAADVEARWISDVFWNDDMIDDGILEREERVRGTNNRPRSIME